jgi:hypothetical protein
MARRDDIFKEFLSHPIIKEKYQIGNVPNKVTEGLLSKDPMLNTISLVVDELEKRRDIITRKDLDKKIRQSIMPHL